jgi:integrase/recombinase XerD
MGVKTGNLKLAADSAMGALHLVRTGPAHLKKDHPFAPAQLYLDSQAAGGVRTQRGKLERVARLLLGNPVASIFDFDWRSLTSVDVEAVRNRLRLSGFSASTINGTLSALKGIAHRAWRLEQLSVQELEMIRDVRGVPAGHRIRPARALAIAEIAELLAACDHAGGVSGARDCCLISLLYGAGLRAREAVRLDLSDYNERAHSIRVHGKGDRDRTIYFKPGGARRAINAWLRIRGRGAGPLLYPVTRHERVVERRLSYSAIYAALERRAAQAGLNHFTPHDLRRSIGTHLQDETGDLELVREFLGHVDVRTTQIYIMRGDRARRRASENVNVPFRTATGKGKGKRRGRRKSSWRSQLRAKL